MVRPASIMIVIVILISSSILSNAFYYNKNQFAAHAAYTRALPSSGGPAVNDPNLKVEVVAKGLHIPTSMAFLGPNDILVLEKNTGNVLRVLNGEILKRPLLHVNVATPFLEWGLLGIAVTKNTNANEPRNVFIYYTESSGTTGSAAGNRLYKYDLTSDNSQLINPKLLLDLPANPANPAAESNHNGGKVVIGPDNNLYTVIGDVGSHQGQAQNVVSGKPLDGTSGIFRLTQDGQPVADNPLIGGTTSDHSTSSTKHGKRGGGEETLSASPFLNYYYAYGIRNSFGMDFDPVTGKLWDAENGPTFGDEINLVNPGFNSGWLQVAGIWKAGASPGSVIGGDSNNPPKNLVTFGGKGVYRAPELSWLQDVGLTALKFLNSAQLGAQYQNDMFVGDVNTGSLYDFKLNQQRDGLVLTGALADKVVHTPAESQQAALGHGFGTITDLQVGPDGYLYVLTFAGNIYRIAPASSSSSSSESLTHHHNAGGSKNNNYGDTQAMTGSGSSSSSSSDNSPPGQLYEVPDSGGNNNINNNNNNDHTSSDRNTETQTSP